MRVNGREKKGETEGEIRENDDELLLDAEEGNL